jgi:gamma-glutamyl hydrolase
MKVVALGLAILVGLTAANLGREDHQFSAEHLEDLFQEFLEEQKSNPNRPQKSHHNTSSPPQINDRPVIGILSLSTELEKFPVNGTSYIAGSYVQWVESGGARVVPIKLDAPISEISKVVQSVNGVLFTGGTADFFTEDGQLTSYSSVGCFIFDLVKQLNDEGVYFPLWATCLGYELINVCVSPYPATIGIFNGKPSYAAKINFTNEALNATLFNTDQGDWIKSIQTHQSINLLNHAHGIAPSTFYNSTLSQFYKVLATGRDHSNTEYNAIIEAHNYPIYGNQYHPEKNVFEWTTSSPIPHNATAVAMTNYYSSYFVAEARRNRLSFGSESALKPYLINNYEPYFLDKYFSMIYVF